MKTMTMISTTAICMVLATAAMGQTVPDVKLAPSPAGQAAVQVGGAWTKTADGGPRYQGGKWVVVNYSRPLLRGRADIFGSGAEYGKVISDGSPVWRAGANATTTLTTQVPLMIGGKTLAPGVYNMFVELKPGAWTLVLSNQPRQPKYDPNDKVNLYGSYNYDPKFDLVRVPMTVAPVDYSVEEFTITFINTSDSGVTLAMAWANTTAVVPIGIAK